MATSKTLTPTNQTISIPEMTDTPDQSVNSNALSKIADAINELAATDIFSVGTAIPENADLNSYTSLGTYYSSNAARSATLSHTPFTDGGFRLFVFPIGPNGRIHIIIPNANPVLMYFRRYDGTNFSAWSELNNDMHVFKTEYTATGVSSVTFDVPAGRHAVVLYAAHMSSLFNNDNSFTNIYSGGDSFADAGFTITKSGSTYTLTRTNGTRFSWAYYWL